MLQNYAAIQHRLIYRDRDCIQLMDLCTATTSTATATVYYTTAILLLLLLLLLQLLLISFHCKYNTHYYYCSEIRCCCCYCRCYCSCQCLFNITTCTSETCYRVISSARSATTSIMYLSSKLCMLKNHTCILHFTCAKN